MTLGRIGKARSASTILVFFIAMLAVACGGGEPSAESPPATPTLTPAPTVGIDYEPSREDIDAIVEASNRFGFDLLAELGQAQPDENLFLSPLSVHLALSMTYNGAAGSTQEAMADVLHISDMGRIQANAAARRLLQSFQDSDPALDIAVANSLWAREDVEFREDFLERARGFYDAEVQSRPFDQAALDAINGWVREKTRGKIDHIMDEFKPNDILVLLNAVYFNGTWVEPFDEEKTKEQPFHLADGSEKPVPMMHRERAFPYLDGDGFQAARLKYRGSVEHPQVNTASMYVFLPDQDSSLDTFLAGLTPEKWNSWMSSFEERQGELALPRFEMEFDARLNGPLTALGMGEAFDGGADFSAMTPANPFIRLVRHKAVVEVNEVGSEAAAVTGVIMAGSGPQPASFVADRPFFFAIVDDSTGTILFAGTVYEP